MSTDVRALIRQWLWPLQGAWYATERQHLQKVPQIEGCDHASCQFLVVCHSDEIQIGIDREIREQGDDTDQERAGNYDGG